MQSVQRNGFTLIELSIVLVIIGLIVGGVLVGRDMIEAATARRDVSLIEQTQSAVNVFRSKYNGLPGDLANPERFFTTWTACGPNIGNGNGKIGLSDDSGGYFFTYQAYSTGLEGCETAYFWNELAAAQLIGLAPFALGSASDIDAFSAAGVGYPSIQGSKRYGLSVTSIPGGLSNVLIYGANQQVAGLETINFGSAIKGFFSSCIDNKLDDGNARTGRIQNRWDFKDTFLAADCHDPATGVYSIDSNTHNCTLRIESGF